MHGNCSVGQERKRAFERGKKLYVLRVRTIGSLKLRRAQVSLKGEDLSGGEDLQVIIYWKS